MHGLLDALAGLSSATRLVLGLLVLLQVGLQAWALVDLARRRRVPVSKWLWLAVIVLLNLLGPLVYFAAARESAAPGPAEQPEPEAAGGDRARRAVDVLYGQEKRL